ncbi:MAG: AraC family transcriptional regulator, partial [Gammaproteobacteria bacterium]
SELAANAGVCRSKLHKCFKQVYGLTPFDYARDKRLEKAKQMLRQGENVTQTAFQLGYSSPSHFAKAFKEHFGYLPLYCKKAENA